MSLLEWCQWLARTPWSIALHESLYMYPLIESTHVLALGLSVGTLVIVDLRLLGLGFRRLPLAPLMQRLLPWSIGGFVLMIVTGLLLFYAIPERTYHSVFFRLKMLVLLLAAANAIWFHVRVNRYREQWLATPPASARIAAAFSLTSWVVVIMTGRMIAYNWFDCDRPQSAFIVMAAGCVDQLALTP